jgi:hypothetical protein
MKLRTLLVLAVSAAGLALAGPASTAVAAPAASVWDYPAKICPTLSVSTTTPLAGASFTVSGVNFAPDAKIRLELHTKVHVLTTVTSDANGAFKVAVKLPAGLLGNHDIVAIGGDTGVTGCPADPSQVLNFGAAGESAGGAGGTVGASGGGTAFTGVDVLGLVGAALALLVGGVLLNRSGRRRRAAAYAGRH